MKKMLFKSKLRLFENSTWGYHFVVPKEIVADFVQANSKRVVCRFNNDLKQHCALLPNKGEYFLFANKTLRKELSLQLGDEVEVEMQKDSSKYGMPMPDELQEILQQNAEAQQFFEKLSAGKQRTLIYIVSKVKNTHSRLNKAMAIEHHLCEEEGEINFFRLNELIKEYNNRYKL